MNGSVEVAPGVHRLSLAEVNCYLVVTADGMTLVDGGLPGTWKLLTSTLDRLGASPSDIDALVLTHGHFDHVGMARRLNRDHSTPVYVHSYDRRLAKHPYRYRHEAARVGYPVRYPKTLPVLTSMVVNGALNVRGVKAEARLEDRVTLDVPGRPEVIWSPGHTDGHCGLYLPDSEVLLSGDALVTLDPYTGERGPRVVAAAATASTERALESLTEFVRVDASVILPGHGEPWLGGVHEAVERARDVGAR